MEKFGNYLWGEMPQIGLTGQTVWTVQTGQTVHTGQIGQTRLTGQTGKTLLTLKVNFPAYV